MGELSRAQDRPGFEGEGEGDEQWRQRDLLRIFVSRGTQGMPYIPTPAPNGTTTPAPPPLVYFEPMIIVAAIGAGIGLICLLTACFIWWCRCCCKRCCMGTTDPERKFLGLRVIVVGLGVLVLTAAFVGLYGGRAVSISLRATVDALIVSLSSFGRALTMVNRVAASFGFSTGDLAAIQVEVAQFAYYVGLAQHYFTPVDAVRLGLLYSSMSLGMLAAIGLGLGALRRRKEVLTVSFVSATLAIVFAWVTFAVNYPLAVTLDDSCVTLSQVLANTVLTVNGVQFLIGCLPPALFTQLNSAAYQGALLLAQSLANEEANANSVNPNFFRPITASVAAMNASFPSIAGLSLALNSTVIATDLAANSAPCLGACYSAQFASSLDQMRNLSDAVAGLTTLQNCTDIDRILTAVNSNVCNDLVVGIIMVFCGAIVIGSLLIPMGIIGLYVSQKFPNRSAAARVKSRILVIFTFLFFHCLVAVLAELNANTVELVVVIGTLCVAALGFIFINIPMNKYDWKIGAQMALAFLLMLLLLACLAGWIYLFYYAVLNNVSCSQSVSSLPALIFQTLGQAIPVCNQSSYAHTLMICIFAGTAMVMTGLGSLLALVLAVKIGCGTPLNLADSDYELVSSPLTLFFLSLTCLFVGLKTIKKRKDVCCNHVLEAGPDEPLGEGGAPVAVGRVDKDVHGMVEQGAGRGVDCCALVGKGAKGALAVVAAQARGAHAAKGQPPVGKHHQRSLVAVGRATARLRKELAQRLLAAAKGVQRQRQVAALQKAHCLGETLHLNQRQNGPKDFGSHQLQPARLLQRHLHQRRGNVQVRRVRLAARQHAALAQQSREPPKGRRVNDARVRGALLRVLAKELAHVRAKGCGKGLGTALAAHQQHVVGRNARLAGVVALAPHDPLGRQVNVGVCRHHHRVLAAQLQRRGGQLPRRRRRHDLAHLHRAREHDVIVPLRQQSRQKVGSALPVDAKGLGVQHAAQQGRQALRGVGRVPRQLDKGRVAGRNGARQRHQGQVERIVPGRDQQNHSLGLVPHFAARRPLRQRRAHPLRRRPLLKVPQQLRHLCRGKRECHRVLKRVPFAKVAHHGCHQLAPVRHQSRVQRLQLLSSPAVLARLTGEERFAQPSKGWPQLLGPAHQRHQRHLHCGGGGGLP